MSASRFRRVRQPVFAGTFYPADPDELRQLVLFCLAGGVRCMQRHLHKAFILPHAGLVYSGPVAGSGYLCLEQDRDVIQRIILLGPSHRVGFHGLALSEANAFATPLGEILVDEDSIAAIRNMSQVQTLETAHVREHSLEVHLPFLQVALATIRIVPLVVGDASPDEVGDVIERLWGGPETRIVISSDLSHFHEYALAKRLDSETAATIGAMQPVMSSQACGASPLNGLLRAARNHHLQAHTLDLRNSGDTAGDRSRVVGYGAFVFSPA